MRLWLYLHNAGHIPRWGQPPAGYSTKPMSLTEGCGNWPLIHCWWGPATSDRPLVKESQKAAIFSCPALKSIIGGSCHKYHFCRNKIIFVAAGKKKKIRRFVATNTCLSRQKWYLWQLPPMTDRPLVTETAKTCTTLCLYTAKVPLPFTISTQTLSDI